MSPRDAPASATEANKQAWDSYSTEYQAEWHDALADDVFWGPGVSTERKLRLLGDVQGKDVLEVGCGGGQAGVWLATRGARVTALDIAEKQLEHGRKLAEKSGVAVRFIAAGAEDLSMLPDASFDVVLSSYALGFVERIDAAFQEAHRVLRPGGVFVFSWSSPIHLATSLDRERDVVYFDRAYFDRSDHTESDHHGTVVSFHRTYGDWHSALTRAGFLVTDLLEPEQDPTVKPGAWSQWFPPRKLAKVPCTMIFRARKPVRSPW